MTVVNSQRSCEDEFDLFCTANSLDSILNHFQQLCAVAIRAPVRHPFDIYRGLNARLKSYWKAAALFKKLDAKVQCAEYARQSICDGLNAVVVGCGPCGLRCAIELALLGSQVIILEKREAFSRNNVLHLWPYLIEDLRSLGAKTFFGKFCAGSIDHISIRTLQCILLKAALLFGVQVFPGVSFKSMIEPNSDPVVSPELLGTSCRVFQTNDINKVVPLTNGYAHSAKSVGADRSPAKPATPTMVNGKHFGRRPSNGTSVVTGWRLELEPEVAVLKHFEVDILIGADGKRSCLRFPCKELRCRLAIAITANFVNYHTQAETTVEEISGVASIFNQQFFRRLASETGVDLENLVYYKDETHYFVMTAKKHSLLAKGVLKQDREDSESLLSADNIDSRALQAYARETADFVTNGQLPRLDFALNARGEPDVDAFDFTRIFAAEYSCRMFERKRRLLMQCLIGDGLFEPFWPTGSGCALGFLSALDAAWAVKRLASGTNPLQVLAQRESVYQRLSQTTAQNMPSNFTEYTLDPRSRYTRCALNVFSPHQVLHLYDSDQEHRLNIKKFHSRNGPSEAELSIILPNRLKEELLVGRSDCKRDTINSSVSYPNLLRWLQQSLSFYVCWGIVDCPKDLTPEVWDSGHKLLCLIHLYRPDLVPEIDQFMDDDENASTDGSSVFGGREEIRPTPSLIRACGIFIEYFDVVFYQPTHQVTTQTNSTFPKSLSDWFSYLALVQKRLSSFKMIEPRRCPVERMSSSCMIALSPRASPTRLRKANGFVSPVRTPIPPLVEPRPLIKRVFRENPKLSVQKGLMSKRRAELIATLHDPASTKRRTPVSATIISTTKKRSYTSGSPSGRNRAGVQRSSSTTSISRAVSHNDVVRANSNLEREPTIIKPIVIPPSVARLFAPYKSSSCCHICHKRLYVTERLTDFDLYFHRHCFRCTECGIQLQPGKATRVRAQTEDTNDKFYCLAHSSSLEPDLSRLNKVFNNPCDASMMERLRSNQFPFGCNARPDTHQGRNGRDKPVSERPKVPSKLIRPPPNNARSALLAGLSDDPDAVMGVSTVKATIIRTQRPDSCDSSSSPPPEVRVRRVGPSGDSSQTRVGIRDERAPSPTCYLAGHLGLPEVERRANWELNTNLGLLDSTLQGHSDAFRLNWARTSAWDEYLASSESEDPDPLYPSNRSIHRLRVSRPHKPPTSRNIRLHRCQPKSSNSVSRTSSISSYSSSSSSCSSSCSSPSSRSPALRHSSNLLPLVGYGPPAPSMLSSPVHHINLKAKHRFCMEPPKPVSIDPKQFISSKNRERTTTSVLSDCSERLDELDSPDIFQASISSTMDLQEASNRDSIVPDKLATVIQLPSRDYKPTFHASSVESTTDSTMTTTTTTTTTTTSASGTQEFHPLSIPTPGPFLNLLDSIKNIDSASTTDQSSPVERNGPESATNKPLERPKLTRPLLGAGFSLTFLGDYDNIPIRPRSASLPLDLGDNSDSSGSSSPDLFSPAIIVPSRRRPASDETHIPYSAQVQRELSLLDRTTPSKVPPSPRTTLRKLRPASSVGGRPQQAADNGLPPRPKYSTAVFSVHSSPGFRRQPVNRVQPHSHSNRTPELHSPTNMFQVYKIRPRLDPRSFSDSILSKTD